MTPTDEDVTYTITDDPQDREFATYEEAKIERDILGGDRQVQTWRW